MDDEDEECSFCGTDLEDDHDIVTVYGKKFCSQNHAEKWQKAELLKNNNKHCC